MGREIPAKTFSKSLNYTDFAPNMRENLPTRNRKSYNLMNHPLKHCYPNKRKTNVTHSAPTLPLLGRIAAGQPIEAISHDDIINLPNLIFKVGHRLFKVKGDEMLGDCICDGDFVIYKENDMANPGDIVVATIDGQLATLKRYHYDNDNKAVVLIPSNPVFLPEEYSPKRITIQGIYVGLLRVGKLSHRG